MVGVALEDFESTAHLMSRRGQDLSVWVRDLYEDRQDGSRTVTGHVLVFGGEAKDGCLVRIHSRCLYGDALQSDDCDCGPELKLAMDRIQADGGRGVLIYLEQEGRGAGLEVKAQALAHGERTGADSYTSYAALRHPVDSRSYAQAATALKELKLRSVRLMTNNPEKLSAVRKAGIEVVHVPLLTVPRSERARKYMESKRRMAGHDLPEAELPDPSWEQRAQAVMWWFVRPVWDRITGVSADRPM